MSYVYDLLWWIGIGEEISDEHWDCLINSMHTHDEAQQYHWPDIVCVVEISSLTCSYL